MTRARQSPKAETSVLLATLLVVLSAGLQAQESPGRTILGQVVNQDDKVVARAIVHLKNLTTKEGWSVVTDKEGRYQFNDVERKADYEVTAEFQNQKSRSRRISQFDTRDRIILNLKLQPPEKPKDQPETKEKDD